MTWSAVQFVVVAIGVILIAWAQSVSIRDWRRVLAEHDVEIQTGQWQVKGREYSYQWRMYRGARRALVDAGVARWRWSAWSAIAAAYIRRWWNE